MSEEDLQPRWLRYGLAADPFFSNALDPAKGTAYPIELFQGRRSQRRKIVQRILDGDHSATLIHAAGGHGKTTLANAACYDLSQRDYVILPEEIELNVDGGLPWFLGRVLHLILQALSDRGLPLPAVPDDGNAARTKHPGLTQARLLVQLTRVKTGAGLDVSTVVGGAGSSIQYDFLQPRLDPGTGRNLLEQVTREAVSLDDAIQGYVVRVNDLDVAAEANPAALKAFFQGVRNILQVPGLHFLMMGNRAVHDLLEALPRVRTEFCDAIGLESFKLDDVNAILDARYKHLGHDRNPPKPPVAPDLVAVLHEVHFGDLRNILRDLRRAVQSFDPVEARPVTAAQALPLLEAAHYRELEKHLSPEAWQTLDALDEAEKPVRKTDLAQILGITEPAVVGRFKILEELSLVEIVETQGRSQFLRAKSRARMALHEHRRRASA